MFSFCLFTFTGFLLVNLAESGKGESDYRAPHLNLTTGQMLNLTAVTTGLPT